MHINPYDQVGDDYENGASMDVFYSAPPTFTQQPVRDLQPPGNDELTHDTAELPPIHPASAGGSPAQIFRVRQRSGRAAEAVRGYILGAPAWSELTGRDAGLSFFGTSGVHGR